MDRSFNSSVLGNRSPFSPRSRQTPAKRSAATPFRKSSRFSLSGRSTQSVQVVLKSQSNCVERFGQPLPVLVTEALTFADRNTVVSAKISADCGYAWLVCGRRLLIWHYRQNQMLQGTPRRGALTNQCYELQLPQSDLVHRAELVSVFQNSGNNMPACIAVSPEGVIRFWPTIAQESVSIEQTVDLQGQECDSLTGADGLGSILATTTCTVVLVQPHYTSGRYVLNCHVLKMPSGWLGGLSKKMSSLIFGPNNTEQSSETRLVRVLNERNCIYVLAGHSLQKWQVGSGDAEHLVYVTDLSRQVKDSFVSSLWENCGGDNTDVDTWVLDLQAEGEYIVLLAAAVNLHVSPQVHYALIAIDGSLSQPPTHFGNFQILKMNGLYRDDNPADSLGYRFLISSGIQYVYNHRSVTVFKPQEEPDNLEFNTPMDFLLGGSICVNTPVFFSRNHGLVAIVNNENTNDMSMSVMSPSTPVDTSFSDGGMENLTIYNFNPEEMYAAYKDTNGQFTAAFIFYIKGQHSASQDIINKLFSGAISGQDSLLDKVIVEVSQDLLNDIPANDPRWLGENQVGLGSSYAMQVLQQLEDKQKAHILFIKFLKESGLWKKMSSVTIRHGAMATAYVLGEHSEKIVAAVAMKTIPYEGILKKAIENVARTIPINSDSGLTSQDVFYRQVTNIYKVAQEVTNICDEAAHSDMNPIEVAKLLNEANSVLLNFFKEVTQYRQSHADHFSTEDFVSNQNLDYLPWTCATGSEGLMDTLNLQQNVTLNYGVKVTTDYNLRNTLYDQLVSLIDYILDGRKSHIESLKGTSRENIVIKQYQTDRKKLIDPLVQDNQWEGAALLAEKYLDFESLVLICDKTDNQSRLDEYMDRFGEDGFSEFVYSWYLQENKQGKLIDMCKKKELTNRNSQQLKKFLNQHPSLSWIQNAFDRKFDDAADTLVNLAVVENESLTRQKTMLSMAKLAKLASGRKHDETLIAINENLELINYQEELPDYVLQQFGYDTIRPRVISPKEMINLYTCQEYRDAAELEFKKALDLLAYIEDPELRNDLALKVWCGAILRDSWDETDLDCPMEILQHKLMFKTADLALVLGSDPQNLLPPLDMLIDDPSLVNLKNNKNFQFLIKAGYELINRIMIKM
ncbi:PREDICTED: nuclear pore complex protein Nup133 [Nicrophorus vespilloides]|uniref:Nuclear pore complex protein Nup133 n=1 Tax=Nicrophorus vespilloides TaxID=110193 RepID=A0ABM1MD34_NICVS|nr:PREDICTED: nuclear pore complex protein Nup133 [Nicrophorus vespilloides]